MSDSGLHIIGSVLTELSNSNSDPFTEFANNNPSFFNNEKPLPSFKPYDNYTNLDQFIATKFSNKPIINITYNESDFLELQASLKLLGIHASQNNTKKTLTLASTKDIRFSNKILKFSGDIQLDTSLKIASHLVIFDQAIFYPLNNNYGIELLRQGSDQKNIYHLYIKNSLLPNLFLRNINHLWFSGESQASNLVYDAPSNVFNINDECTLNIAKEAFIQVISQIDLKNINCINAVGSISANIINIEANQDSEYFIASSGKMSAISELNIHGLGKVKIIQDGFLLSHKLSIKTLGEFHNTGSIILGESHDRRNHVIMVDKFFNYVNGKVNSERSRFRGNGIDISTINSSGNLGIIEIKEIAFNSPGNGELNATFYNNGSIIAFRVDVGNKAYILNDQKAVILTNLLNAKLCHDLNNIFRSSSIINRGGTIRVLEANLDVFSLLSREGEIGIDYLSSSFKFAGIEGGKTSIKDFTNDKEPIFFFNNPKGDIAVEIATSQKMQSIIYMIISNGKPITLSTNKALPLVNNLVSKPNSVINSNSSDPKSNYIYLNGNFSINGSYVAEDQSLHLGQNIASNLNGSSVKIESLFIEKNSLLVVNTGSRVFVGNLQVQNAKIKSFGEFKVKDNWHLSGQILLEGNISGPTLQVSKNLDLTLSDTYLAIDGDMFNNAIIKVLGTSVITSKNFAQIGKIIGTGNLKIKSDTFIMKVITETLCRFVDNHHFVDTNTVSQPEVELGGALYIQSDKLSQFEGGKIKAERIVIQTEGKVIVLPTKLYHKIHNYWNGGYNTKETLDYILSEFNGENGIKIYSKEGNLLVASIFKSKAPISLYTNKSNIIQGISKEDRSEYYNSWTSEAWHGASEATHEVHASSYHSSPILADFSNLQITSLQDSSFLGFKIKGDGKSKFVIGEEMKSSLAKFMPMMEVRVHRDDHKRTNEWFGFIKTGVDYHFNNHHIEIPILNLIESSNGVYGLCYGKWVQIGTNIITKDNDNLIYINATESIDLFSATKIEIVQNIHKNYKINFVSSFTLNEISVGIAATHTTNSKSTIEKAPVQAIYQGNMHLIAPKLHTIGVNASGGIFKVEAEEFLDEAAKTEYNYKFKYTEIEISTKIGIKSSFGSFLNNIGSATTGIKSDSPEGLISASFAGYAAFLNAVQMMSRRVVTGGAWINMHSTTITQTSESIKLVPSSFSFSEVNIKAENVDLLASQISAYNAYIQADKLNIYSGEESSNYSQKSVDIDIDIPLTTGSSAGINLGYGEGTQYTKQQLHASIRITNDFVIQVSGKTTIKGATISARNLDASFGELILESVKDIVKNKGYGINIGLSTDQNDRLKALGGSYSKGLREVVTRVTSIIGTEKIKIVIAHALHLNGAMIANAQRNTDGTYNDLGNLQLIAGQLFVRHIYQIDEGITFSAAVNFARKMATEKDKLGEENNQYKFTFGLIDGNGEVFATCGKGKVIVTDIQGDKLNRDINKVNTGIDYDIKIDPIDFQFQGRDYTAEEVAKKKLENDGIFGIFAQEVKNLDKDFSDLKKLYEETFFGKEDSEFLKTDKTKNKDPSSQSEDDNGTTTEEDEDIIDLDKEEQKTKEHEKNKEKNKQDKDLPKHFTNLYKKISDKVDILNISEQEKIALKSEMLNTLNKARNAPIDQQSRYMKIIFDFIENTMPSYYGNKPLSSEQKRAFEEKNNEDWLQFKKDCQKDAKESGNQYSDYIKQEDQASNMNNENPAEFLKDMAADIADQVNKKNKFIKFASVLQKYADRSEVFIEYSQKWEQKHPDCSKKDTLIVASAQTLAHEGFSGAGSAIAISMMISKAAYMGVLAIPAGPLVGATIGIAFASVLGYYAGSAIFKISGLDDQIGEAAMSQMKNIREFAKSFD